MKRLFLSAAILLPAAFLFLSEVGLCADGQGDVIEERYIKAGIAKLFPYAAILGQYDDNIYITDTDTKDDYITNIIFGTKARINPDVHTVSLDYKAKVVEYADYHSEDSVNHYLAGVINLDFDKIKVDMANNFDNFKERDSAEITANTKRRRNTAKILVTGEGNRLGFETGIKNKLEYYRSGALIDTAKGVDKRYRDLDRMDNEYSLAGTYLAGAKTKVLFEFDYGTVNYGRPVMADSDYFQYLVGLMGNPAGDIATELKVGYRDHDYKNNEKDFGGAVVYGMISDQFNPYDMARLDLQRTVYESSYKTNNYYTFTYCGLGYDHKFRFNEGLLLRTSLSYQISGYPIETTEDNNTRKRGDDLYTAGIGLDYQLKEWATLNTRYDYKEKNSNFSDFDYVDNAVSIGASLKY